MRPASEVVVLARAWSHFTVAMHGIVTPWALTQLPWWQAPGVEPAGGATPASDLRCTGDHSHPDPRCTLQRHPAHHHVAPTSCKCRCAKVPEPAAAVVGSTIEVRSRFAIFFLVTAAWHLVYLDAIGTLISIVGFISLVLEVI